jgi:hypothetical protein
MRAPHVEPVAPAAIRLVPRKDDDCYRNLAVAVLSQAILDARGPLSTARRSALAFLRGCEAIDLWAALAGVEVEFVRECARSIDEPANRCRHRAEAADRRRIA